MNCLVELYDGEQLNNIIDILAFSPKEAVFLYDAKEVSFPSLKRIEEACLLRLPAIRFSFVEIGAMGLHEIKRQCKRIIWKHPGCYFDITGGDQLHAIGAYLACIDTYTPIFQVDLPRRRLLSVSGCKALEESFSLPKLSMDVLLALHGARVGGHGHPQPQGDLFPAILKFSRAVFDDVAGWKDFCLYLQTGCSSYSPEWDKLRVNDLPLSLTGANQRELSLNRIFFELAVSCGFLQEVTENGLTLSFRFLDAAVKRYMTDFGTWLELFCYIELKNAGCFDDVRMSVKVDWAGNTRQKVEVTNEIDVTCFYGIHPVFISCKLSEPSSDALQELSVYRSYFGGAHSGCVLATLGTPNRERSHLEHRAEEMGIVIAGGNALRRGEFAKAVRDAARLTR